MIPPFLATVLLFVAMVGPFVSFGLAALYDFRLYMSYSGEDAEEAEDGEVSRAHVRGASTNRLVGRGSRVRATQRSRCWPRGLT